MEDDISSDGWITWFCEIEGHEFFVDVDEDFIRDSFNLYGLKAAFKKPFLTLLPIDTAQTSKFDALPSSIGKFCSIYSLQEL